jgi:secreted trypsin-like serine protease
MRLIILIASVALVSALQTPISLEELASQQLEDTVEFQVDPEYQSEEVIQEEAEAVAKQGSCTCGVRNPNGATRIVGGVVTKTGEIPWRVLVFPNNPQTGRGGTCGGTIISPNWILTAAHCTMDIKPGEVIDIFVGAQANPLSSARSASIRADRYIQHPAFNRNNLDNDMALVHLPRPLTFRSNISPACLPFGALSRSEFQGATVLASGWGTTRPVPVGQDNNDRTSNTLLMVDLPVLTTSQCSRYIRVTNNMICTYQPGKDTCQGDSGGSIDYQNSNGLYYSIGVVSFGYGCAQQNNPGVYAKVTQYLTWIEQTTRETFCKK